MGPHAIVSYDDTLNDQDALMLGRLLRDAGASLTLAYVRHSAKVRPEHERLEEHEAEALLERGARWLGDLDTPRRIVLSASTPAGLKWLAEHEEAEIVVFGSDYRTAAGHVAPQKSAQALLEGGPAAVAIAPASFSSDRKARVERVGLLAELRDDAATETAHELAEGLQAEVTHDIRRADIIVVGSRAEAPAGRVMITARAQGAIENATVPVLVVARGVPVRFAAPVAA